MTKTPPQRAGWTEKESKKDRKEKRERDRETKGKASSLKSELKV